MQNDGAGSWIWPGNCLELYYGTTPTGNPKVNNMRDGDIQIVLSGSKENDLLNVLVGSNGVYLSEL